MARLWKWGTGLSAAGSLLWGTWFSMIPPPDSLRPGVASIKKADIVDRDGTVLSTTLQNPWNVSHHVELHTIPSFLQQAFLAAEDQRFYQHHGADWLARAQALIQNVRARRFVRGASTITEQVVRMLHPRPRTLWARWVEGWEALWLERRFSKADILECYLNQVPYARQRRGVVQAAHLYFARDLSTLNQTETLALATLVRAPSRFDLKRETKHIRPSLIRLANRLHHAGYLSAADLQAILTTPLQITEAPALPPTDHFLRYVQRMVSQETQGASGQLQTTLDAELQHQAYLLLTNRLRDLRGHNVTSGALLVLNHQSDEILAWINVGESQIDAILTPRQPGSTLKPFLYAMALEYGWTASTLIEDAPLAQSVGAGLHTFRNYSGRHYGPLRLRLALGNSLNIPAIQTINFVGTAAFLERLHRLGFRSLTKSPEYYGHGLALGNGEVTLFELVQAYATLARHGVWRPARAIKDDNFSSFAPSPVYSPEVSALIGNILADPDARRLEFGSRGLLNFPIETAVKTGTSSDYRDAWAVGFSHRYTVGVWMGNLNPQPMRGISGAIGPALILRSLFAELHRHTTSEPLWFSHNLIPLTVCESTGMLSATPCPQIMEWFIAPHFPIQENNIIAMTQFDTSASLRFIQPTTGLHLAMDPRIPDSLESFTFILPPHPDVRRTDWIVDGRILKTTHGRIRRFHWNLRRGAHKAMARIWHGEEGLSIETSEVHFLVK